jgi:restriction system protein
MAQVQSPAGAGGTDDGASGADLEELARDQIAKITVAKFKGHGLARLVEAILKAQGYTTYRSPEGPDGGIGILAGAGPLGFGSPRLCVQVKSQDMPVESKALNELRGAMQTVNATEGLFVSWSGFKSSVYKQAASSFFSVRLWTQKELLEALFAHYDHLDEDLKAELPLKRIWTVATQEEE